MFNYSVNQSIIQQPTVTIEFKSLPYVCASGIYDATVNDLILGELTVNGVTKPILRLGLICAVGDKLGQLSLNLETDINDKRFKDTQDFAIVTGMVDPQGKMLFREEVVQLKTPLSNGRTSITTFPDFEGKKIKVAVRRSARTNTKGVPYMNASAYLNINGQTAFEMLHGQPPKWVIDNAVNFASECDPLMEGAKQEQQEYNYTTTQQGNASQQDNPYAQPSSQAQNIYGMQQAQGYSSQQNTYTPQPQQPSSQAQNIYGMQQGQQPDYSALGAPQTKQDEIPF